MSREIDNIISENNAITSTTAQMELYKVFGTLNCVGVALTLPAFITVKNGDTQVVKADGIACFKGDKLIGFLSPEQSKYLLFATGEGHRRHTAHIDGREGRGRRVAGGAGQFLGHFLHCRR